MGKRSDFNRIERDLYNTPEMAVKPLLPWLHPRTTFIEPCYGEGSLAFLLTAVGHKLMRSYDLPNDARSKNYDVQQGEVFVTNPPYWGRPSDLHPLIENLSNQAPTWLLMSSDWLFNKGSGPLTRRLRHIVAIGRVKWIPDSPYTGKDNCAWLLFDRSPGTTVFTGVIGRKALSPGHDFERLPILSSANRQSL